MSEKYYESWDFEPGSLICEKCQVPMEPGEIVLHYMGNDFSDSDAEMSGLRTGISSGGASLLEKSFR